MPAFEPHTMEVNLSKLPFQHQLVFTSLCCERLIPNYMEFTRIEGWGDFRILRETLDWIWHSSINGDLSTVQVKRLIQLCEKEIPDTEEFESIYVSFALDVANAIVETLKFIEDREFLHIVDIASLCRDTVDMFIQEENDMDYTDPEFEQKILRHPLMVNELQRQNEIIRYLESCSELNSEIVQQLRNSSHGESILRYQ
jgi:uncharacterized protein YjaG (DUF416 family)